MRPRPYLRWVGQFIFGLSVCGSLFAGPVQSKIILKNGSILLERIERIESYGIVLADQQIVHYNIIDSLFTNIPAIVQDIMTKTQNSSFVDENGTYGISVGSAKTPIRMTTKSKLIDYQSSWIRYTNDSSLGLSAGINYSLSQKHLLFDIALVWGSAPDLFSEYQIGYQFGTGSFYQTGKFRMNTTLEYTRVFDPKVARTETHRSRGRNLIDIHASLHVKAGHKQNILLMTGLRYRLLSDSERLRENAFIPYLGIGANFLKAG